MRMMMTVMTTNRLSIRHQGNRFRWAFVFTAVVPIDMLSSKLLLLCVVALCFANMPAPVNVVRQPYSRHDDFNFPPALLPSIPPHPVPCLLLIGRLVQVHDPVTDPLINACGIRNLLKLADDLHLISRRGDCGGEVFGVHPIFTYDRDDGRLFHASIRVWPCDGHTLRRARTEWDHRNHISVFELKSVGRRLFMHKRLTDRLKQIVYDELAFIRNPFFNSVADEFQARVAFGQPQNRNGIVYSAIRKAADPQCLVRAIGRILRNVFMFLNDHEYIPLDVDMHTVTLHMQFDEGPGQRALKLCFEAWAWARVNLPRQRAAAVPSPPVYPRPTRPSP